LYKYATGASGNVSPQATPDAEGFPLGVAVDSGGNIWNGWYAPSEYDSISVQSSSFAYIKTIGGAHTGLVGPYSLAFDASGNVYVANDYPYPSTVSGNVEEFASSATGNAYPSKVISGSHTLIVQPTEVWVDQSTTGMGRLLVSDYDGNVLVFGSTASGNATPVQDITSVAHPTGVTTDSSGNIYVSVPNDNSIRVFSPGATGNATPTTVIKGSSTNISNPKQLYMAPF
jgi:hypothetical protein